MFLFDGAICKSIVMMWIPTVIVTQPLDLMKTISREQLSDSRDMGFVHSFRLESVLESTKKEQLQTDNYDWDWKARACRRLSVRSD